jgi:phytoene synthase
MSALATREGERLGFAEAELERVLRAGSKTFHLASRVLPRRVRGPTLALYAFCRTADDDVDEPTTRGGTRAGVELVKKRIERVFASRGLDDVVDRAFADVVTRFDIPRAVVDALAEGMEWDAENRTYRTVDDVRAYGARVAGTVGVMMTLIMGNREPDVLARACDLGVAMQLTNIARDVGEDARRGRLYLPTEWLVAQGVSPEAFLADPTPLEGVRHVTGKLLRHADGLYARSDDGVGYLPPDCRMAIRAARLVYAEIGNVIRARDLDAVSSRAVVSLPRKLWLMCAAVRARFWRPEAIQGAPSREAAPLVECVARIAPAALPGPGVSAEEAGTT